MEYFKCSCNGSRTTIKILYASLIIVICATPISSNPEPTLTYDQIYNTTRYAQIPRHIRTDRYNGSTYNNNLNDTKENLFKFKDRYEISSKRDLLVGFAHDPFRYSIPEADYARGVRVVNPQRVNSDRGKRGVVHLYNMLTCATGCDPVSYKGYGCYCGFLGSGRPTDGIDNCCRLHDECYENIYCPFYTVYFQPYYWKCYHGEPLCALENFQTHPEAVNGCAGRLCECDRRFAMCVKKYSCPRGRALCKSSPLRLIQNILMFK